MAPTAPARRRPDRRWERQLYARFSAGPGVSEEANTEAALAGCLFARIELVSVGRWFVMHRRLGRNLGFRQQPLFHGHHEWVWSIGDGLALEVLTGAFFWNQLQRNLLLKGKGYVGLLRVNVVGTARDIELGCRRFDNRTVHIHRLALDGIPDGILVFLFAIGEDELPGREVHLIRGRSQNHVVRLFQRRGGGLNRKSGGLGRGCLRLGQNVGPAIVSAVVLHVLIFRVLFDLLLILRVGRDNRSTGGIPDSIDRIGRNLRVWWSGPRVRQG